MGIVQKLDEWANLAWYHVRRSSWAFSPRSLLAKFADITIDRPIFLLGNQGGGLTLVSRMLRRHNSVVNVTGNSDYWSGADEMHRVMVLRLPPKLHLASEIVGEGPPHECFSFPRSWSYGSDDLVDAYHLTEEDYDRDSEEALRSVIAESIYRFGRNPSGDGVRFIDKSQSYTLKIRFIDALLKGTDPYFLLLTRNPYAACYRAAKGKAADMARYSDFMPFHERLDVCSQHWSNVMRIALEDGKHVANFETIQFERILRAPENSLRRICEFLEIPFTDELLPSADDQIPFGSRFRKRWYPLRPDVNESYLERIDPPQIDQIAARLGETGRELGYKRPDEDGKIRR